MNTASSTSLQEYRRLISVAQSALMKMHQMSDDYQKSLEIIRVQKSHIRALEKRLQQEQESSARRITAAEVDAKLARMREMKERYRRVVAEDALRNLAKKYHAPAPTPKRSNKKEAQRILNGLSQTSKY